VPRRVVAVEPEPQQGAGEPGQAGEQRPEQRGHAAQTGERNQPNHAGENQYENTVFEFESGDQREQTHTSQHEQQPAHHLHLVLLLSPLQDPQHQKVPEVEGQEEESTSYAEQRTDGLGEPRQKSPQITERVTLQAPGNEERKRQDRQRADVERGDLQQFGAQNVLLAEAAHVEQEAPLTVLFERGDAALHIAVPEAF
uniref:Uncharacterized protein n=1 Tax=Tetraodon nigroviridis TaxID=99883 RepID=H3C5I5_TETNG